MTENGPGCAEAQRGLFCLLATGFREKWKKAEKILNYEKKIAKAAPQQTGFGPYFIEIKSNRLMERKWSILFADD